MNAQPGTKRHYAWYILCVCFILNMLVQALVMSVSNLYVVPMYEDLQVPRVLISLQSICIVIGAVLTAPFWGKLYKTKDARRLLPLAVAGTALCTVGRSFCPNIWCILPLAFVKGIFFTGSTLLPISVLLTAWFKARRGFAISLAAIGSSFGGVILSPLVEHLISSFGWRATDRIMGAVLLLVCVPLTALVIRNRPKDVGLLPYGTETEANAMAAGNVKNAAAGVTQPSIAAGKASAGGVNKNASANTSPLKPSAAGAAQLPNNIGMTAAQARKSPLFYLFLLAVFCMTFANGAALQLPTYLADIGYDSALAARAVSGYMAIGIPGKLFLGWLADKKGVKTALVYNCCIGAAAFACFIFAENFAALIGIVIFFGLTSGITSMLPTLLTARIFGNKDYGPIYGMVVSVNRFGGGVGTLLVAFLFDLSGNYGLIWPLCLAAMLVTMFAVLICFRMSEKLLAAELAKESNIAAGGAQA